LREEFRKAIDEAEEFGLLHEALFGAPVCVVCLSVNNFIV
jgi:hypothetical protein